MAIFRVRKYYKLPNGNYGYRSLGIFEYITLVIAENSFRLFDVRLWWKWMMNDFRTFKEKSLISMFLFPIKALIYFIAISHLVAFYIFILVFIGMLVYKMY